MAVRAEEIASILRDQIEGFGTTVTSTDVGSVIEAGDGVARIHGLSGAMYSELLEFSNVVMGIALNLEEESVSAVVLGGHSDIKEGDEVRATGRVIAIPVGDAMIGAVARVGITPQATAMREFWTASAIAALVVGMITWAAMFWAVIFHRKRAGDDIPPRQTQYNLPV